MSTHTILSLKNISKKFGDLKANDRISLDLYHGEIHSIIGENGAGKTTFMNIISGIYKPTEGDIILKGQKVHFNSPHDSINCGIGMVHQHFMLADNLKVWENIAISMDTPFFFNKTEIFERIAEISRQYELSIPLDAFVWQLSVGEKQRIEIIKVLLRQPQIIIFDEPTTVLSPEEIDGFLELMRSMKNAGKTVLFVSHKLKEVLSVSDRITILRNGKKISTYTRSEFDEIKITQDMMGTRTTGPKEKIMPTPTAHIPEAAKPTLIVDNLWVRSDRGFFALKGISFNLYPGEILGIAGVEGNGQKELEESLYGLRKIVQGHLVFNNRDITHISIRDRIMIGFAYIPSDRKSVGVSANNTILKNIMLKHHLKMKTFIHYNDIAKKGEGLIKKYRVAAANLTMPAANLSGGNMQKMIVAREFELNPTLIIAAQPTRGIDFASTEYIHELLIDFSNKGVPILLISSDLDELLKISHRILVLYNGKISGEFGRAEFDIHKIGERMVSDA